MLNSIQPAYSEQPFSIFNFDPYTIDANFRKGTSPKGHAE